VIATENALATVLDSELVTRTASGAASSAFERLARSGLALPATYRHLLDRADGLTAYGGYFRVFGIEGAITPNLLTWNDEATWKFAWPPHARDYLCFGETAFGHQYAFRYDELRRPSPPVYLLEAWALNPEPLADTFEGFLVEEFLRNAAQPYDEMITAARGIVGDLSTEEHVTYSPSPLLTGEECIDHIVKLPAAVAMIFNGDLARQLCDDRRSGSVVALEVFDDEQGRPRIQVKWTSN
jgi:hypothetical protein